MLINDYKKYFTDMSYHFNDGSLIGELADFETPESSINFEDEWTDLREIHWGHPGHQYQCLFERFNLEVDYFQNKLVAEIGCGNGRIGELGCDQAATYVGFEPSSAIHVFDQILQDKGKQNAVLIKSEFKSPPGINYDIVLCWGVLHHVADPEALFGQMANALSSDGEMLLFIYHHGFARRGLFSNFFSGMPLSFKKSYCHDISALIDNLQSRSPEAHAELLKHSFRGNYASSELTYFQYYDGISPRYHWDLEDSVFSWSLDLGCSCVEVSDGCYIIRKHVADVLSDL